MSTVGLDMQATERLYRWIGERCSVLGWGVGEHREPPAPGGAAIRPTPSAVCSRMSGQNDTPQLEFKTGSFQGHHGSIGIGAREKN